MKPFLYLIAFIVLLSTCKKDKQVAFQSKATLIGYDYRMCAMCGGIEIKIVGDTNKNPPYNYYLIGSDLSKLGIPETKPFPINIELNWRHSGPPLGNYGYITVSAIQVIK